MSQSFSGVLTPNVVTSITIDAIDLGVNVINRYQAGELWVRYDGTNPTVGGNGSFLVLGASHFTMTGIKTVKLISNLAILYTVETVQ